MTLQLSAGSACPADATATVSSLEPILPANLTSEETRRRDLLAAVDDRIHTPGEPARRRMEDLADFDATLHRSAIQPPRIEVRHTGTAKGLGVFTLCEIESGAVVEWCLTIVFKGRPLPPVLREYLFDWEALTGQVGRALPLGYGSVYNSANPANMRFEAIVTPRPLLKFVAVRPISKGEELTVNYSGYRGAAESANNDWFAKLGKEMLR